jgi:hypothetical protein
MFQKLDLNGMMLFFLRQPNVPAYRDGGHVRVKKLACSSTKFDRRCLAVMMVCIPA